MSGKYVDKVVRESVTICDVCGGEVDKKKAEEDREYSFSISTSQTKAGKPVNEIGVVKFRFPGSKLIEKMRKDRAEAEEKPPTSIYIPTKWYDVHGECLANLIDAAVAHRLKKEAEEATHE